MLQNVYAAGKTRHPDTTGLNLRKFERMPTIIGTHQDVTPEQDANVNLDEASQDVAALHDWVNRLDGHKESMPSWLNSMQGDGVPAWLVPLRKGVAAAGVHGALKELEKWVPGAGLALLPTFFPGSIQYEDSHVRDNTNKKFWRRASHTRRTRRLAERARRNNEGNSYIKSA